MSAQVARWALERAKKVAESYLAGTVLTAEAAESRLRVLSQLHLMALRGTLRSTGAPPRSSEGAAEGAMYEVGTELLGSDAAYDAFLASCKPTAAGILTMLRHVSARCSRLRASKIDDATGVSHRVHDTPLTLRDSADPGDYLNYPGNNLVWAAMQVMVVMKGHTVVTGCGRVVTDVDNLIGENPEVLGLRGPFRVALR